MKVTTIGIHGVDDKGKVVLRKPMSRAKRLEFMANRERCLVGMSLRWGARFGAPAHRDGPSGRLTAARFVPPYRKSQKNDGNDAEAICEAVTRPNMRFVLVKSAEQQALLSCPNRDLI